jgi:hypothetical protein
MNKVWIVFNVNDDITIVDSKEKALNLCIDIVKTTSFLDYDGNVDRNENQKLVNELLENYKEDNSIFLEDICWAEEREVF